MKILLVGPYPPPHGGVSVHVAGAMEHLRKAGIPCRVLNLNRSAPESAQYIRVSNSSGFLMHLLRHVYEGWTPHLHTNGHNLKSWLIALACGAAGRLRSGALLTLHSGMAPGYIAASPGWRRRLLRITCSLYGSIICVTRQIEESVEGLGLSRERLRVLPAFLPVVAPKPTLSRALEVWVQGHQPVLSTALFFRPEYGFELLIGALAELSKRCPGIGCLVMGSGEQESQARSLVREAGLEEAVLFLGDVPHETCLGLMSLSDLFVRPTLEDGDSVSVREAISIGVPVVASNAGTRPPETLVFEAGNRDDLIAKIDSCLEANRSFHRRNRPQHHKSGDQARVYWNTLQEIYKSAVPGDGGRIMKPPIHADARR